MYCLIIGLPLTLYRWVFRTRTVPEIAGVISRKNAPVGDRVLGVSELVSGISGHGTSPELVDAAIEQADRDMRTRDFRAELPE